MIRSLFFVEKKTLLLDLDETLVHCDKKNVKRGGVKINVKMNNMSGEVSVFIRPHIKECLKKLKEHYEIVLFTAAYKEYADAILNYIDPKNQLFDYRLYKKNCFPYNGNDNMLLKDLRVIKNRNLKDIVLVDNSGFSFVTQPDNGVPMLSYYGKKDDDEF